MISSHHHHHVVPLARISLILSRHFSLSFIASGRSSGLLYVCSSWSSCFCSAICGSPLEYIAYDTPPYVGVHRSTSLMMLGHMWGSIEVHPLWCSAICGVHLVLGFNISYSVYQVLLPNLILIICIFVGTLLIILILCWHLVKWFLVLVGRVFTNCPGDLGSIPGWIVPKTLKMVLDTSFLTLSDIRYVSRVKWSNPGEGVAPSPTPRCNSYWKGSLLVTLDNCRQQLFNCYLTQIFLFNIYEKYWTVLFDPWIGL